MKIAIIGSRNMSSTPLSDWYPIADRERWYFDISILDSLLPIISSEEITIISGGARGIDKMAEQYAKDKKLKAMILEPDWDTYGKRAGFLRNDDIVKLSDVIIAVWDNTSNGTYDTIKKALELHKPVYLLKATQKTVDILQSRIGITGKIKATVVNGVPDCIFLKYRKNNKTEYVDI